MPPKHGQTGKLLIVDDEPGFASSIARLLRTDGFETAIALDASEALVQLSSHSFDAVLSDVNMPDMNGLEMLQEVRQRDLDVPVVFLTGDPTVEAAATALELGAFRYLLKSASSEKIRATLCEAAKLSRFARARREADSLTTRRSDSHLEERFHRAVDTLRMAYQPIVNATTQVVAAYEALLRSGEPTLPTPEAVLEAAERLRAIHLLGRVIREHVARTLAERDVPVDVFVNLHPADFADEDLYREDAPLTRFASQIVLEITERASLEGIGDIRARVARLRTLGFRVAVDDLGAGYAGLSYFASLEPDVVKLDMSLVRGIDEDRVKQSVASSMTSLCRGLGMTIVAEGVETMRERDTVVRLGCDYVQGFALARPGPPFPKARWPE